MGIGVRSFLVDRDGSVSRIPWCRMSELFQGRACEEFRRRSGQSVRCAIVFIEFERRRPVRILRTEFNVLYLDERGALDSNAQSQQLRLIGQSLDGEYPPGRMRSNLIDMRPRLARKKLRDKFEWTPSEEVLETIFRRCL
ncbi:MAG TPA: hypothetical protein VD788_11950 [Candidatus Polarisedimenticolaceae bacterium]|nr:hypothetical protein [Candidatus Polarisedimenticolaceae bacterium]